MPLAYRAPLLPNESAEEFVGLQSSWLTDFPGQSHTLTTLRQDLLQADWLRRRAALVFHQLDLDLYLTGLPMPLWDRITQAQYTFIEKCALRTQREFHRVLKLLQSNHQAFSAMQGQADKQSIAKARLEPPPAPPVVPARKATIIQNVEISVVDGKLVHQFDVPPEIWAKRTGLHDIAEAIKRHYFFANGEIPGQYQHLLIHNGVEYAPAPSIYITYSIDEFLRISQREVDAGGDICFDGERLDMHQFGY